MARLLLADPLASEHFFFLKFIYFERERENEYEQGRGRERGERENPKQALGTEPDAGLELTNREVMT